MKKVVLNNPFSRKLDRLPKKVGALTYLGEPLDTYKSIPLVAIVGTRKPTPYGKQQTEKLATELARAGVVIVSGLAYGVDALAHSIAVSEQGRVIAVLPSGLKNIYPVEHEFLADKILQNGGTLISEYPTDHKPRMAEFLERNRIIAALSDAIIIPEAAQRSGSLNTAKHATSIGVPICIIPGNVTSPMSAGTNQLLKEGAQAITDTNDVLKILGIRKKKQKALGLIGSNPIETTVLKAVGTGILTIDELVVATELSLIELQATITMLEVQEKITVNSLGEINLN